MGGWEVDLNTLRASWTDGMYRIHGLEPGAVEPDLRALLALIHPDDRDRMRAVIEHVAERPDLVEPGGVRAEYRAVPRDGSVRHLRLLGRIDGDRWVGVAQDVTAEVRTQRELHLHYAVGQALREWESFEEGGVDLLRRMGTALECSAAALWLPAEDGLRCRAFWHDPEVEAHAFEATLRDLLLRPGEGKPGIAWRRREPVLSPDVANDPLFRPRDAAVAAGLQSSIAFPAVGPDGPLAVLSLYSREKRAASPSLLRTLTGVGRELGRFLARRRAQLGPRPLSQRELEVLALAAEGLSGPRIAEQLFVSPSTVKTHLEHIYNKLGVSDRAGAVAIGLRTGLLS